MDGKYETQFSKLVELNSTETFENLLKETRNTIP